MKVKICLLLIFLFSFYGGNAAKVTAISDSKNLDTIKYQMCNYSNFIEDGVKITYKSNLKKEDEIELVKRKLETKFNKKIIVDNDEIDIRTSFEDVKADFFFTNDTTIVDLYIVNYNEKIEISKLMKELTQLQSKNAYDIRYFQYIKGKINNIEDTLINIKELQQIKNIDTLDIHNGYVGTANFNNGERVNISLNRYDRNNYLIIGTPVIYTTY